MTTGIADILTMFQNRLLTGAPDICAHLADGGPFLTVYDHAYQTRLLEVMGEDFPAVHTLLGDAGFAEAARAFIQSHPSLSRSVRWLGREFPGWLRRTDPWRTKPVVADMASFEWAISLAFDAPDSEALSAGDLAQVAPEAWHTLAFDFHPALNTLDLGFDVAPFHQSVAREQEPEAAPVPFHAPSGVPETWAVWRDADTLMVRYRALAADETAGLAVLRSGGDFAALCEVIADHGDPDNAALRAAGLLGHWIEAGWLAGLSGSGGMSRITG